MASKNGTTKDNASPALSGAARVTSPAGCQERRLALTGTSNPQSGKSNAIPLPLTTDAAVRVYKPMAAGLAAQMAANIDRPDLRDDLESVGLEALWEAHKSYDPGRGCSWAGWAKLRIEWAMLHWIDKELHTRRKHQATVVGLDENQEDVAPRADDLMVSRTQNEEIQRAVQCLTARQQTIVQLVYEKGLTVTGAANGMGLGRTTVSNDLSTALRSIREALQIQRLVDTE